MDQSKGMTHSRLHIIAMLFMLCDHLWGTLFISQEWLTCVGRMAFPIFAFLTAEGYRKTKNLKRYMGRLLICAILSEIPFNWMISGSAIYPYHQNVLWTFLISIFILWIIDHIKIPKMMSLPIFTALGYVAGYAFMVDYYGVGILTVLMFYYLDDCENWDCRLHQAALMIVFNAWMLGGYCYNIFLFGISMMIPQQSFALLSLPFIWCYKGRKGWRGKGYQWFCYAFYPIHMLILSVIRNFI